MTAEAREAEATPGINDANVGESAGLEPVAEPVPESAATEAEGAEKASAERSGRRGVAGWFVLAAGMVFVAAGAAGWAEVRAELADEHVTVSADAERFAGDSVTGPFTAYTQADTIKGHVLESTGGKSFAELDRNDPARETALQGASVRSSLMLSVLSFGVAALAIANGIVALIVGAALLRRR